MLPVWVHGRDFKRGYVKARRYCRVVRHQMDIEEFPYPETAYQVGWNEGVSDEFKLRRKMRGITE